MVKKVGGESNILDKSDIQRGLEEKEFTSKTSKASDFFDKELLYALHSTGKTKLQKLKSLWKSITKKVQFSEEDLASLENIIEMTEEENQDVRKKGMPKLLELLKSKIQKEENNFKEDGKLARKLYDGVMENTKLQTKKNILPKIANDMIEKYNQLKKETDNSFTLDNTLYKNVKLIKKEKEITLKKLLECCYVEFEDGIYTYEGGELYFIDKRTLKSKYLEETIEDMMGKTGEIKDFYYDVDVKPLDISK